MFDLEESCRQWSRVPIDDFGYLSAEDIFALEGWQRQQLVLMAWNNRWNRGDWRNRDGCMEAFMFGGLKNKGQLVLDYGTGIGLDSIRFGKEGFRVISADIHPNTVLLAIQNASMFGVFPDPLVTSPKPPFFNRKGFDLFWSLGVLHHTPLIGPILQRGCENLAPGGECRIALYSDHFWRRQMGDEPPTGPIQNYPRFTEWVRKQDAVGLWADWYDKDKITEVVKDFGEVAECNYLSEERFLGVVIKSKC